MRVRFDGEIFYWRGPSPFHFVTVPPEASEELRALSPMVSYGWGVLPVVAEVGATRWTTSLFPKEGAYVVPLKVAVRDAERLALGDRVTVVLSVGEKT